MNIGDIPVNVIGATRTELTIQIPANAPANSRVSIKGSNMELPIELSYMDSGISQLFDFNNWPGEGAFTHSSLMLLLIFCVTEH